MKVFLTGGTGFIGRPLTRALLQRGWDVTLLTRAAQETRTFAWSAKSPDFAPKSGDFGLRQAKVLETMDGAGARAVRGDVTDKDSMRAAMSGADVVIHNAGWYEIGIAPSARAEMRAVNVGGTENVLSLAVELKIPKILYTSSTTALGDTGGATVDETFARIAPPNTFYEQTKTEAHAIALGYQKQGAPVIVVCPAQAIGKGDHSAFGYFARLYVRHLLPPIIWAPEAAFTFAHVDDVAEGVALAAEKGRAGETYFLAGETIVNRELVQLWKRAVGGIPPFIWLPKPLALAQGALVEPLLRLMGIPAFISREVVAGSFVSFRYSSEKAKRELGWKPRSVEQAWTDTLTAEKG
ncbi:MAG: NAD-dependent epimerase/dehydratase family protein [Chloroflexota bacterium]